MFWMPFTCSNAVFTIILFWGGRASKLIQDWNGLKISMYQPLALRYEGVQRIRRQELDTGSRWRRADISRKAAFCWGSYCSRWRGETMSLSCGHQWDYCSLPWWYMSMESHGGIMLAGENRRTQRKTCPSNILSTTSPTWNDSGANVAFTFADKTTRKLRKIRGRW
jgi:hypothetical protein